MIVAQKDIGERGMSYDVIREGGEVILKFDYDNYHLIPSIEDDSKTMFDAIKGLSEVKTATKIVFYQKRDYEYDYNQVQLLKDVAKLYDKLSAEKDVISASKSMTGSVAFDKGMTQRFLDMQSIISNSLRGDPYGSFIRLKRLLRHSHISLQKLSDAKEIESEQKFSEVLTYVLDNLEKVKLIKFCHKFSEDYSTGSREIYNNIFSPLIRPDFMFTKLMASYPRDGEIIDSFQIDTTEVTIFKLPNQTQYLYHILPLEFKLDEDNYELLDTARNVLAEHKPESSEFVNPARMREVFHNIGYDMIRELARERNMSLSREELESLTKILIRYTVGFGLIEVLLSDEDMQDVSVNSPQGSTPIFIVHGKYNECVTNILPTPNEAESWATKLRLMSGRSLDEADPILDTEIEFPTASVRVSAITYPLDPTGLAFSFRRHRDKPWTLPLFIKNKMINPVAAGLISFLVDGNRSFLICGTRSSGKSSFLSSVLIEIMRRYRILTIEDSVSGDSIVPILVDTEFYRTDLDSLFDLLSKKFSLIKNGSREIIDLRNTRVPSVNSNGIQVYSKATTLSRHKVKKQLFRIITKTGRQLTITQDHSLFTIGDVGKDLLSEITPKELVLGSRIAVPKKIQEINFNINTYSFYTSLYDKSIPDIYCKVKKDDLVNIPISYLQKKKGIIPLKTCIKYNLKPLLIKVGRNSLHWIPSDIDLSDTFLTFIGLWMADGCYDKNSIIMSVSSNEEKALVDKFAKNFELSTHYHSDKFSLMLNSKTLKALFEQGMGLKGNAYTKRIPSWIFTLSLKQKASFLKGFFSGDGCTSDKEVLCSLSNVGLLDDIQSLFLEFGIIFRINRLRKKKSKINDRTKDGRISDLKSLKIYESKIGYLQNYKNKSLFKLIQKTSTHQSSGGVLLSKKTLDEIKGCCSSKIFNSTDYISRGNAIGIDKLNLIIKSFKEQKPRLQSFLKRLVDSDLYWDEVVLIEKIPLKQNWVYDFSVPGEEVFLANNIFAHNTLELPGEQLRALGYNIQPMKVASALGAKTTEFGAADGIRATLRLGDSALIVGEVRSDEAKALYEAMRVGAAANVVAGTIHGDSPYGIFDRVVNDIGVPKTSFKATDIIIIANPIHSADGLHKFRRVTQITEVRKDWVDDPNREHGFVDLMKYDPITDELKISDALINGDSDILKTIAGNIKEFSGSWDAIWDNIMLRSKIKETLVNVAEETKDSDMLEAPFVIKCNDAFHNISAKIKDAHGHLESDKIFEQWDDWLKREVRKRKQEKALGDGD